MKRNGAAAVPAFVMAHTAVPMATRVLVLHRDSDGTVRYSVFDGGDTRIGDADVLRDVANTEITAIIGSMLSGRDRTDAQRLAQFGIVYVVANDGDAELNESLDGAVGLRRVSGGTAGATSTWEVQAPNQRLAMLWFDTANIVAEPVEYTVNQTLSGKFKVDAVDTRRVIVLAEAGGAWTATLAGRELAQAPNFTEPWRQAWVIPAGAHGEVSVSYSHGQRFGAVTFQLLVLFAVVFLALPAYRPYQDLDPELVLS